MSERIPTPEQRAAIDAEGEVLVSASAGSGKTYVMVEKIISLILSGRADVSSVLAVTFTNLAAAEMKERLRAALVARLNAGEDGASRARLRAQLSEVAASDICTLHAFCTAVIRRYFYETELSGNFRILEEQEAEKLRARATDAAFERLLGEKSELFASLSAAFAGSRGFGKLADVLQKCYQKVVSRPDHADFLRALPARYGEEGFSAVCAELLAPARSLAQKLRDKCEKLAARVRARAEGGLFGQKHLDFLAARLSLAEGVLAAPDLFAAAACAAQAQLPNKPSNAKIARSGTAEDAALDGELSALKGYVDGIKKVLSAVGEEGEERAAFFASGRIAAGLCELLLTFDEEYAALKRRANALDFSDLEHFCLALLEIPRVREEVKGRYTHVFVDEYQDVNPAQERILSLLSGDNVFMVGDAKQSIYGFRGCSAAFFAQKYARLSAQGRALTLNGNFRSTTAVLKLVNDIFSEVMTAETGSVDYASTSMIFPGSPAQEGGFVGFAFVPEREEVRAERGVYSVAEHLDPAEDEPSAEGALIADLVLQEVGRTRLDPARGEVRIGFGDVVVLTRGKTAKAGRIVAELVRRGIPVASAAEVNICDYPEVKALVAILQYLDNGAQDIPLAAALKSAMGGLNDEQLANIRLRAGKDAPFYAACEQYAEAERDETAQKLRAFFALAARLRVQMQAKTAAEMLARILSETGMELKLLATSCGAEKVRRVSRLIEACGELAVPEFLERLKGAGNKVGFSEAGGENAVRVMTMHASKGLEFPVVIVAGMNDRFSAEDMKGVLLDDEWGFAPLAYDFSARTVRETLLRAAVRGRLRRRRAEDEMRLLYVALTRAKSALHLVFSQRKAFDAEAAAEAGCFADFIDLSRFPELEEAVYGASLEPPAERVLAAGEEDAAAKAEVLARYRRPYAHAESLGLPVKTSPSELLRSLAAAREETPPEGAEGRAAEEFYGSPADAAAGTAYHAFLERADLSADPAAEAARIAPQLRAEGYAPIDEGVAAGILRMPVFGQLAGYELRREQEFLLSVPACEVMDTPSEDELLVQGVIDLLAVKGEECIVIDYKYSSHGEARLLADYAPQLRIYVAAARRVPGVKRVRAYIVNIKASFLVQFCG